MKEKLIIITGPTAVGKTSFSIEVAKKFNGEIISGDSMQIYKGLDIGTAKVTLEEMEGIPHHLINIKSPDESYTVSDFQKEASRKIKDITERNRVPIIVGGTGLYIESLLYPVTHSGSSKPNIKLREELTAYAKTEGNESLWNRLNKIDPKAAEKIHPNNVQRVIRALEVYYETGKLFSSSQDERKNKEALYDTLILSLNTDRELLYNRINQRVDEMVDQGLIKEVETLWRELGPEVNYQSTKGIGYKELFEYFNENVSLETAIEMIKRNSRRYAKRQLTWFRNRFENVNWYDFILENESKEESFNKINAFLKEDFIETTS